MKKIKLDQYFLAEECPYTHKRKLKFKNIKVLSAVIVGGLVIGILFFGGSAEKQLANVPVVGGADSNQSSGENKSTDGSIQVGSASTGVQAGQFSGGSMGSRSGAGRVQRQYTASQLVRNSGNALGGFALPMGTTFPALLVNTLLSSDSAQPVIAQINDAVFWKNNVFIPEGTRAIGNASFDDTARRLQIRFHTLVYPGGDQHAISALALLADGSSGIPGDYHSGEFLKQTGRFAGNFVGGLADGLKDKQPAGAYGGTFEPGSLKNGILNGITLSALDQSKRIADEAQETKAYLEVSGGTVFVVYLEKEYQP